MRVSPVFKIHHFYIGHPVVFSFFSNDNENMQNENVGLTDIQVQILEQEYKKDETSGTVQRTIDINHLEALVKLMAMEEGEVSERAIENWWYEKDLKESLKKMPKGRPYTEDMNAYLQIQYEKNPDLGSRAQEFADLIGTTKTGMVGKWHQMRKKDKNPKYDTTLKFDANQIRILEETFKANPSFSPKAMVVELGLDPNNIKHFNKVKNWKQKKVKEAKEEGQSQPGTSKDESKPGTSKQT